MDVKTITLNQKEMNRINKNDNKGTLRSGLEPFASITLEDKLTVTQLQGMIIAHLLTRGNIGEEVEMKWSLDGPEGTYPVKVAIRDYPSLYKRCHDLRISSQVKHEKGWVRIPNGSVDIVNDLIGGTADTMLQLCKGCEQVTEAINQAMYTDEDEDAIRNLQGMVRNKLVTIFTKFCALRKAQSSLRCHSERFVLGDDEKEEFDVLIEYDDELAKYSVAIVSQRYEIESKTDVNASVNGISDTGKPRLSDVCYSFARAFVKKAKQSEEEK